MCRCTTRTTAAAAAVVVVVETYRGVYASVPLSARRGWPRAGQQREHAGYECCARMLSLLPGPWLSSTAAALQQPTCRCAAAAAPTPGLEPTAAHRLAGVCQSACVCTLLCVYRNRMCPAVLRTHARLPAHWRLAAPCIGAVASPRVHAMVCWCRCACVLEPLNRALLKQCHVTPTRTQGIFRTRHGLGVVMLLLGLQDTRCSCGL